MFSQLVSFIALATLLVPVPSRAVPGAAWVRRQEDAQSSLTLDPAVISQGLEQDGQGDNPDPGQVRSLTSSNNFINFCLPFLDQGVVLTNGAQVIAGSCNQTPMGRIISLDLAPRSKFVFPPNGDESISPNTAFTVKMKLLNMEAGNFVNAQTNYYAAPQQVNGQGVLIGHTHFVIEPLPSLDTTEPLDPLKFAFFKGINNPVDGDNIVQTSVTAGLAAGFYRLCSINTAANHQPALVSNAQHGALDDCSYFTIKEQNGNNNASTTEAASATDSVSATDSASASASTSDAASTTDTATDVATDAPQATQSTDGSASASSTNDAQSSATPAPDSTTNTDAAAPTETSSADNGNGNQSGNNNGNQGGNNGNTDGNNGGNNGNNDANNGGDNQNAPSDNSASAPASTDATPSDNTPTDAAPSDNAPTDAAPSDNAPTDAAPSNNAPTDAVPSDNTPTDAAPTDNATPTNDSSAAPAPTDATPSDVPSQGNNTGADNGNNSNNDNQGGNNPATTA